MSNDSESKDPASPPAPKPAAKGDGWRFIMKDVFVPIVIAVIGAGGLGLFFTNRNDQAAAPPPTAIIENETPAAAAQLSGETPTPLTDTPTETSQPLAETPTETPESQPETPTETTILPTETLTQILVPATITPTEAALPTSTFTPESAATATSTPEPSPTPTESASISDTRVLLQFNTQQTGFWMDVTEVTNAQYQACVTAGTCSTTAADLPAAYYADDHPVVGVSWEQAVTYCTWAEGRLPTVEEWLMAATSAGEYDYPWGDDKKNIDDRVVVGRDGCGGSKGGACPVGSKSPLGDSPAGIQDLIGNVWEWTSDPGKKKETAQKIGGSWAEQTKDPLFDTPLSKHIIREEDMNPKDPQNNLGFRCVYDDPAKQN